MRAIEVTGTVEADRRLRLDRAIAVQESNRVRVIILLDETDELTEAEWLRAARDNPALAFLASTEEDLYTVADGKPFNA